MLSLLWIPFGFFVDQFTKEKALAKLGPNTERTVCKGKVKLSLVYNHGAFLGLLRKYPKLLLFINIFSAALVAFALMAALLMKGNHLFKTGLSLMGAGALGNIYDRIRRKKVVDFFAFQFKPFKPNIYFNIADFFVFFGAFFILLSRILRK